MPSNPDFRQWRNRSLAVTRKLLFPLALICLFSLGGAPSAATLPPYGANLFQGNFVRNRADAVLLPGDQVVLRLWGGNFTVDDTFRVGPDGHVDLPEIGSLPVSGLDHGQLEEALRSKLAAAGHSGVQVYAAALNARPVAIFVTGGVVRPGLYTGAPGDPVLSFLDRAGGIDSERGSYRDIRLIRKGESVSTFDLYPFVRQGALPSVRLQDGDTLFVSDKGPCVTATGAVRNAARFEFLKDRFTGAVLAELAEPTAQASHIALTGTRNNRPYSTYLPRKELGSLHLEDGDQIQFIADTTSSTILVEVQGAVMGASRFPVRRGARLQEIRNFIAVDPDRASLQDIYIKRLSVAARQKKAITESLRRLEETVLTASSASSEEAQIRSREAEMVAKFVERAKAAEPEGVVVLDRSGASDITLEHGDIIVIPPKSDVVLVSGEVMVPQAMLWGEEKKLEDYVQGAGGYGNRADPERILILHQNGAVSQNSGDIRPGDQILILPKVESKSMQAVKDISQVLMQVAVSTRALIGLPSLLY